jgi:hypothetical protein
MSQKKGLPLSLGGRPSIDVGGDAQSLFCQINNFISEFNGCTIQFSNERINGFFFIFFLNWIIQLRPVL